MEIRLAERSDIHAWCGLVEKVKDYFPGLDMESYRQSLQRSIERQEALVATDSGKHIIGALVFSHETCELMFLAVDPGFRKQGVAKALVQEMISYFPGESRIYVVTYREGDPLGKGARALYHRLGFQDGDMRTVFDYPCQELYYIVTS